MKRVILQISDCQHINMIADCSLCDALVCVIAAADSTHQTIFASKRNCCIPIREEMNHPELATLGLGDVDDARLQKAIEILVDANKLPRTPTIAEVFTRDFLPPKSERPTKLIDAKG